jgi:CheY-like chemotaxis protein
MKTILVVDDRPDARYVTVRTLSAAGYDVRETATGRDALRLARLSPDLIVLDVVLPDIDGFEVCRRLKDDMLTVPIPVLHKTAVYDDVEHRKRGLAAGADAYLSDPVEPALFLATVERLLNRSPRDT